MSGPPSSGQRESAKQTKPHTDTISNKKILPTASTSTSYMWSDEVC